MSYFFIILFYASLLGIIFLITRRSLALGKERPTIFVLAERELVIEVPDLEHLKDATNRKLKKIGYNTLVATLRVYVISVHFVKQKSKKVKERLQTMRSKRTTYEDTKEKEVSKFLKMVSEYKSKIKHIKDRIQEEEGLK